MREKEAVYCRPGRHFVIRLKPETGGNSVDLRWTCRHKPLPRETWGSPICECRHPVSWHSPGIGCRGGHTASVAGGCSPCDCRKVKPEALDEKRGRK